MRSKGLIVKSFLLGSLIILASVPGFLRAPYNLHFFDEPYQILTAFGYKDASFSPLSAFLGNIYGNIVGWKWLWFRYLALALNVISIAITSFYFLKHSKSFKTVAFIAAACVYFSTIFHAAFNVYGWNDWTVLFLVASAIVYVEYVRRPSVPLLVTLGVLSSFVTLCRLPSVCVVFFLSLLILFNDRKCRGLGISKRQIINWAVYFLTFLFCSLMVIWFIYGMNTDYLDTFGGNGISHHGIKEITGPFLLDIPVIFCGALLMASFYKLTAFFVRLKIGNLALKRAMTLLVLAFISFSVFVLLYRNHSDIFRAEVNLSGAIFMALAGASFYFCWGNRVGLPAFTGVFLLSLCICIGSNTGLYPIVAWPFIPLAVMYMGRELSGPLEYTALTVAAGLFFYSVYAVRANSFMDVGTAQGDYEISEGLTLGIRTSADKGELVSSVVKDFMPYTRSNENYFILKNIGSDFLWEYLFLKPNEYMWNRFGYEPEFDDPDYVGWAHNKIDSSEKPVAVLYMNDDFGALQPTLMKNMLDNRLTPSIVRDKYIIYTSE